MDPNHWASDKESSIENQFSEDDELNAIAEKMRRSSGWLEHEEFHRKKGEEAVLVISEDSEQIVPSKLEEEFVETHHKQKAVMTGWCQCQSPTVKLLLGEDGEVRNEPMAPVETNSYGVASSEESTGYKLGESQSQDLYKRS